MKKRIDWGNVAIAVFLAFGLWLAWEMHKYEKAMDAHFEELHQRIEARK